MIWDSSYPNGTLINAFTLDTVLRNAKTLIRERAVAYNGSYSEHSFFGAGVTGRHTPSQSGFIAIHASYQDMIDFNCPSGSLHYVKSDVDGTKIGLYVNTASGFLFVVGLSHTQLSGVLDDDHTQYYLETGIRPMTKELQLTFPAATISQEDPTTNNGNPMLAAHNSESWWAGHGVDGEFVINRHFPDGFVGYSKINYDTAGYTIHSASSPVSIEFVIGDSDDGKHCFFPRGWITGAITASDTCIELKVGTVWFIWTTATAPTFGSAFRHLGATVIP